MVIHQFNKLIRNKWVWGAFAIVVSLAFCFDGLFSTREEPKNTATGLGTLDGEEISARQFDACREMVAPRGQATVEEDAAAINHKTWQTYAALKTAADNGLTISDRRLADYIRMAFSANGGFSSSQYEEYVRRVLNVTPEQFEERMRMSMLLNSGVRGLLVGSAVWVSPMELAQHVTDLTDTFTVRVARFAQTKEEADAVKVDEVALKAWYEKNKELLALPERQRLRIAAFDATRADVLAKVTVSDEEMHDYYDANSEKWETTDTNGVKTVKAYEEVKGEVEKTLRQIEAVEYFVTNLQRRAYADLAPGEDPKASRLAAIAKAEGGKVTESPWFTLSNKYVANFMSPRSMVLPGARNFEDEVAQLDPASPDFRYGIVSSDRWVWLVERIEESPAHTPDFNEAKGKIEGRALADARREALEAKVNAIVAKGAEAVLATPSVSTNMVFSVADLKAGAFEDQNKIVQATRPLVKDGVSQFVPTVAGQGFVIVCVNREPGNLISRATRENNVRDALAMRQVNEIYENWLDANLKRLDYQPSAQTSDVPEEEGLVVEDAE